MSRYPALPTVQPALKRIPRQYQYRPFAVYDRQTGEVCASHTEGRVIAAQSDAPASHMLEWAMRPALGSLRPQTIWLTGGTFATDRPPPEWWREPLAAGYTITRWHTKPWRVTYRHPGHDTTCDLAVMAPWFGDEHEAAQCYRAWHELAFELRRRFDSHATLLSTPAATGMDLLERSLPVERCADPHQPGGVTLRAVEFPPVSPEIQELLVEHFGQGRVECVAPPKLHAVPALYVYDARWQYAACCSHLPIGPWVCDDVPDLASYRVGFYRVDAQVPRDWRHIGLIGMRSADEGGRRVWPRSPGQWIRDAWVTSAELDVAMRIAGWDVAIKERVLAQPDGATRYSDPSRVWVRELRSLREQTSSELVARATRHLLIDAIGSWWRRDTRRHEMLPHDRAGDVPREADDLIVQPWGIEYTVPAPLSRDQRAHYRPEWAATVWGRALARTHKRALAVPYDQLVWVRSDSVVTSREMVDWHDTGQVGAWRIKHAIGANPARVEQLPVPRDETAYRRLWRFAQSELGAVEIVSAGDEGEEEGGESHGAE